ncbi:hypothetical protein B0T11DRAFT_279357, partial [Plectosphaerella cucumerina]
MGRLVMREVRVLMFLVAMLSLLHSPISFVVSSPSRTLVLLSVFLELGSHDWMRAGERRCRKLVRLFGDSCLMRMD